MEAEAFDVLLRPPPLFATLPRTPQLANDDTDIAAAAVIPFLAADVCAKLVGRRGKGERRRTD